MKYKIIRTSETKTENRGFIKVTQILSSDEIDNLSVSIVEISGKNKKIINKRGDAAYYVIAGSGFFTIDGNKTNVSKGDLVFISRGTPYFDEGNLKMVAINTPRYLQDYIEYLE